MFITKKIELEIEFNESFVPPEKFDFTTRTNYYLSKCRLCPFLVDEEGGHGPDCILYNCVADNVTDKIPGECPIKKFFND